MSDSVNMDESQGFDWNDYSADDYMQNYDSGYDSYGLSKESERARIEKLLKSSVDLSPDLQKQLEDLERNLLGRNPDLKEIDKAIDEIDPTLPEKAKGPQSLDAEMQDYLTLEDKKLTEVQKTQVKKWIASYQLDPEGTKKLITKEFNDLQSSVGTLEVYGSKIGQLADATGMAPAAIQEVFQKHGITDTQNLSDKQIQLVLPDLGGKTLDEAKASLQKATANLQTAWDKASTQAEQVNAANRADDEDSTVNDFSSFKTLSDIANHKDPTSQAYDDALRGVAQASAPILAALKGVPEAKVKILAGSPELEGEAGKFDTSKTLNGMLSIDGEQFNVIGNPRTGETIVSDQPNPWPSTNKNSVKIFVNEYTALPSWVNNQGYPVEGYTGGGGGFDFTPFLFF